MACLGPCPSARKDRKYLPEGKIYLSRTGTFSSPFKGRSVNCAVSNVEHLSKICAGIKFIYFCDWLQCILTDKHAMFNCQFRTCSFFHAAMQANIFSIDKTHQHILFWRDIHSFVSNRLQLNTLVPLSMFTIKSVTRNSDSLHVHVFGLRPVCTINFSRDQ